MGAVPDAGCARAQETLDDDQEMLDMYLGRRAKREEALRTRRASMERPHDSHQPGSGEPDAGRGGGGAPAEQQGGHGAAHPSDAHAPNEQTAAGGAGTARHSGPFHFAGAEGRGQPAAAAGDGAVAHQAAAQRRLHQHSESTVADGPRPSGELPTHAEGSRSGTRHLRAMLLNMRGRIMLLSDASCTLPCN